MIETFTTSQWNEQITDLNQQRAINKLENGHVLYFPELAFALTEAEKNFLTPDIADPSSKNVGYHAEKNKLWGVKNLNDEQRRQMKAMLRRFATQAQALIHNMMPHYQGQLTPGRTSYRPVQIIDRKTSFRKDDKRLHVDAFPSSPNQGNRILRVFCNINPSDDRVWRLGESFENVARRFAPSIAKPFPGSSALLRLLKITKSRRTPYDHYMLHIHDNMKEDEKYQATVSQEEVRFPPATTWIVQTDHVSHAAMQGQYLLEQTFYLPVEAMQNPNLSPLRVLEKILDQKLT